MSALAENLQQVERRIAAACAKSGRNPDSVTLVAVSKKQPIEKLSAYLQQSKRPVIGENYVQEFKKKREQITVPFSAHLLGPLQRNKAKDAVRLFDVIESIHSEEIAEAIDEAAMNAGKTQEIFLQVNVSADPVKSGFSAEAAAQFFRQRLPVFKNLRCTGLMTITELYPTAEEARSDFQALRKLAESLGPGLKLSMGMSQDFEVAIEEGATHVRIGTALFGERET